MLALAFFLSASTALAQPPEAPANDDEARGLFEAGRAAFDDGRYEAALDHFMHSYDVGRRPEILFNIALCHERLGHDAEALSAYRSYLDSMPDAPNAGDVRSRIAALERAEEPDRPAVPEPPDRPVDAPAEPVEARSGGRLFTWIAAGGAVALGAVGAVLWATADSDYNALRDRCIPMGGCLDADIDGSINTRAMVGNVLVALAGVALAGAVVLFFVEGSGGGSTEVGLGPSGIVVRGRM